MSNESSFGPSAAAPLRWVVCLCADWCGTCRDYRAVFDQLSVAHPDMHFVWIDIEDQADLVGDLEVETFPTLLIADGPVLRFFGPLTPQAQTLARMLVALPSEGRGINTPEPGVQAMLDSLQAATPLQTGRAKIP